VTNAAINLDKTISEYVSTYNSTGCGAYVGNLDRICALGSGGYAQKLKNPPFQINGRLSMGSNTKSMTATVVAILLESATISAKHTRGWNTTLFEIFPDLASGSVFGSVTLAQLAGHFSGLAANPAQGYWPFEDIEPSPSILDQRQNITLSAFQSTPTSTPGTAYLYSNRP
jgi:CubicO group peptidase (beta-lactamase class C family)